MSDGDPSRLEPLLENALAVAAPGSPSGIAPAKGPERGTIVGGHLRIEKYLKSGKYGAVYLATDIRIERQVALKFFTAGTASIPEVNTEGKALGKLNHRNLVRVYSANIWQEIPYLELEYVDGEELRGERRASQVAVDLGFQLADALAHAHEQGVAHLDISSKNLLIDTHGRLRVIDFGMSYIATLVARGESIRAGTPGYMAPEQWACQPCQKSDVFAAGAVIYQLITGKLPLGSTELHPDQPQEVNWSGVPRKLRTPLRHALAWSPDDRCDASQLASSLREVRDRGRRRSKLAIMTATLLAVAVAAVGAWWSRMIEEHRRTAEVKAALRLGFDSSERDTRTAAAAYAGALKARDPQAALRARAGLALVLEHLPRVTFTVSRSETGVENLTVTDHQIAAMTSEGIIRFDLQTGVRELLELQPGLAPCRGLGIASDDTVFFGLIPTKLARPGTIGLHAGPCFLHRAAKGTTVPEVPFALRPPRYVPASGPVPLATDSAGTRLALWAAADETVFVYEVLGRELRFEQQLTSDREGKIRAIHLEFFDHEHIVAQLELGSGNSEESKDSEAPKDNEVVVWSMKSSQPECRLEHARYVGRIGHGLLVQRAGGEATRQYDLACKEYGAASIVDARRSLTLKDAFVVITANEFMHMDLAHPERQYFVPLPNTPPYVAVPPSKTDSLRSSTIADVAVPPSGRFVVFGTVGGEIGIAAFASFEQATTMRFASSTASAPGWLAFSERGERLAIDGGGVVDLLGRRLPAEDFPATRFTSYLRERLVGLDFRGHLVEDDANGALRTGSFDGITTCGDKLALVRGEQLSLGVGGPGTGAKIVASAVPYRRAQTITADASCSIVLVTYEDGQMNVFRDQRFVERRSGVDLAAVAPGGDFWIEVQGGEILARAARSMATLWRGREHQARATAVAVDRQGTLIATGDGRGCVVIWTTDGVPAAKLCEPLMAGVSALAFSPDGRRLAVAGAEGNVVAGSEGNVVIHDLRAVRAQEGALDDLQKRARCASGREFVNGEIRDLAWDQLAPCLRDP